MRYMRIKKQLKTKTHLLKLIMDKRTASMIVMTTGSLLTIIGLFSNGLVFLWVGGFMFGTGITKWSGHEEN